MPEFEILSRHRCYDGWAKLDEAEVRHRFDGDWSAPSKRLIIECGDAAAVLLYDEEKDSYLFVRQLRVALGRHGHAFPIELVAGKVDEGETAEQAARREVEEEVGHCVGDLRHLCDIFPSPGVLSEKVSIFSGTIGAGTRIEGWEPDESED